MGRLNGDTKPMVSCKRYGMLRLLLAAVAVVLLAVVPPVVIVFSLTLAIKLVGWILYGMLTSF